jgi:hypothetical protein
MTRRTVWYMAACTLVVLGAPLRAQSDRYAPVVVQLPATPRASVLGAGPGMRDIETIFSNPALVGITAGTVVGLARYQAGTMLSMASAASLGSFSVGIGGQHLDANADIPRLPFWSYSLRHGGPVAVASTVGAFGLATTFRGWRVGAAAKYLDERHGGFQDGTASLDLGVSRDVGRFTTGVTVQNIGAGIRYAGIGAQLPLRMAAGAAMYGYVAGPLDLGGSASVAVLPDGTVRPAIGVEAGYVPLDGYTFQARVGVRRPELRAQNPLSFGGSASLDRFTLDYAFEDWNGSGTHRLALRVR